MHFNDLKIQYCGFHPSEFSKHYIESLMQEIREESPYGSSLRAMITKRDRFFKGVVKVRSPAGAFFAVAKGQGVREVSEKLLEQMRKRLGKWKSKRFEHRSLRDLTIRESHSRQLGSSDSGVA